MRKFIVAFLAVVLVLALSGCESARRRGTWESQSDWDRSEDTELRWSIPGMFPF